MLNQTFCQSPLALAVFLVCAPVYSQTVQLDTVTVQGSGQKLKGLKAKQATGSRLDLTALETAASVESLDVATQRARGDTGVSELVARATGISAMASPGSGTTYAARGFSGNESVAQAEDGLRMPTGAGTQSMPSDSFGYERIEILRGPASVLFGDGSIGGLVNLVRKQPGQIVQREATLGLGSFGDYRAGLGVNQPLSTTTAVRVDALAKGGEGWMARGRHSNRMLMSTLRWQATPDFKLDFSLDIHRDAPTAYFGSPLKDGQPWREVARENYNVQDGLWRMDQERARVRADWQINDALSARAVVYRFNADRAWRNLETYALSADKSQVSRADYYAITHTLRQSGARAEWVYKTPQLQAVAGLEGLRMDFVHSNDGYAATPDAPVPLHGFNPGHYKRVLGQPLVPRHQSQVEQQALFAEAAWQAGEKWLLTAGLRHERTEVARQKRFPVAEQESWGKSFHPTAWRLAAVLALDAEQSVYAQTSTGTDPIGSIATLSKASTPLRLTEGRQYELGYKQASSTLEWSAALYQITKDHILTQRSPGPEGRVQGGSQRSTGLEWTARWTPTADWRVDANLSALRAEYLSLMDAKQRNLAGHVPRNVPERQANLWVTHQLQAFELGGGLRYVGQRFTADDNTTRLAPHTVWDASAGWKLKPQATLRLHVRNLSNAFYATSAYSGSQVMLAAPRSVQLVLDMAI